MLPVNLMFPVNLDRVFAYLSRNLPRSCPIYISLLYVWRCLSKTETYGNSQSPFFENGTSQDPQSRMENMTTMKILVTVAFLAAAVTAQGQHRDQNLAGLRRGPGEDLRRQQAAGLSRGVGRHRARGRSFEPGRPARDDKRDAAIIPFPIMGNPFSAEWSGT